MMRRAGKNLDQEALPPCCLSIQSSRMPSISLIRTSRQPIYLRASTSNRPSTAKWYKVGQPCYEDKIQELNTDYAKICISPKPSGAPLDKVPMPILIELEHQARQNISTLNFVTTFAKTSSSCNVTLEKCQHSLKATFKKVKSQIRKGANPEKAAKRGYEEACEYLDLWNKAILIQQSLNLP